MSGLDSSLNLSLTTVGLPDGELSDTMNVSSKMNQKTGFDKRQKKKWLYDIYFSTYTFLTS